MNLVELIVETAPEGCTMDDYIELVSGVVERNLVRGIREGSPRSRLVAIRVVHENWFDSEEAKRALLSALHESHPSNTITLDETIAVREAAAHALIMFGDDEDVQLALLALAGRDVSPQVSHAALQSLAKMYSPALMNKAMEMLQSGDPNKNLIAAKLLAHQQHAAALPHILAAIQQRHGLCQPFIRMLGQFATKPALDALLVYARHRKWKYREAAVSALADFVDRPDVRAVLVQALTDSRQGVRIVAMQAFAQTGHASHMDLVLSWLEADSYAERQAAAEAMVHFKNMKEAAVRLEALAHDEREGVAGAAAYALRYYPGIRAARAILHVINTAFSPLVRKDAFESLRLHPCTQELIDELECAQGDPEDEE